MRTAFAGVVAEHSLAGCAVLSQSSLLAFAVVPSELSLAAGYAAAAATFQT